MTDREIVETAEAAFKAFDSLAKGQAVDITKTKTWKIDKQLMREICFWYIDTKRLQGNCEYVMNDDYTVIKRMAYYDETPGYDYWVLKMKAL